MSDTESVPLVDVIYALRATEVGYDKMPDSTPDGITSAVWNGYLTKDGLTDEGRKFLDRFGFLVKGPGR